MNQLNLVGQRFGKLLIVSKGRISKNNKFTWNCICDCGKQLHNVFSCWFTGKKIKKSCGCNKITMTSGQKFNRLTLNFYDEQNKKWNCTCDCGNVKSFRISHISSGNVKSCGCLRTELNLKTSDSFTQSARKYEPRISSARRIWKDYKRDKNSMTFEEFYSLSQMNCTYCGVAPYRKFNVATDKNSQKAKENGSFIYNGLDRIDNSKIHNFDNCVSCCNICNTARRSRSQEEFKKYLKNLIYSEIIDFKILEQKIPDNRYLFKSIEIKYKRYNDGENLTINLFYSISQMNCFYCGSVPLNNYNAYFDNRRKNLTISAKLGNFNYNGLDRINSSKPHNLDNLVPCCKYCNFAKSNMSFVDFQNWIRRALEFNEKI